MAVMNTDNIFPENGKEHKALNIVNGCETF